MRRSEDASIDPYHACGIRKQLGVRRIDSQRVDTRIGEWQSCARQHPHLIYLSGQTALGPTANRDAARTRHVHERRSNGAIRTAQHRAHPRLGQIQQCRRALDITKIGITTIDITTIDRRSVSIRPNYDVGVVGAHAFVHEPHRTIS